MDGRGNTSGTVALVETLVRELRPDVLHANQFAPRWRMSMCRSCSRPQRRAQLAALTLRAATSHPNGAAMHALVSRAVRRADRVVRRVRAPRQRGARAVWLRRGIDIIHNGWPAVPKACTLAAVPARWSRLGQRKNNPARRAAAHGWDPGEVYLAGDQRNPESGSVMSVDAPIRRWGKLPAPLRSTSGLQRTAIYLSPRAMTPSACLPLQAALHGAALLLSDIPSYRELWMGRRELLPVG